MNDFIRVLSIAFFVTCFGVFSVTAQTLSVDAGSPQNPQTTTSFGLTLSDPTGNQFDRSCYADGYGNLVGCNNNYSITISQSGYTYYTGSSSMPVTWNGTLAPTMGEVLSPPNNQSFDVTVTDSYQAYQGQWTWSCNDCFRTSNLAVSITNNAGCDAYGNLVANVSGGLPPYSYSWNVGGSSQSRFIDSGGTYSVTVTDANTVSQTASITVANPLSVSSSNGSYSDNCTATSVSAAVDAYTGTSPFSYEWDNSATGSVVSGLTAGSYVVTVTDDDGCVATSTSTVTYSASLTVESGGQQPTTATGFGLTLSDPTGSGDFDKTTDAYGVINDYDVEIRDCAGTVYFTDQVPSGTLPTSWDGELDLTMDVQNVPPANALLNIYVVDNQYGGTWTCSECFSTTSLVGDECGDAIDISGSIGGQINMPMVTTVLDNTGYTSISDPVTGYECFAEGPPGTLENTMWVHFTGDGNTYQIRSVECNATNYINGGDTQVAAYTGDCNSLTPVACNDDEDVANFVYNIQLDLPTIDGTEYYLMIDGWSGSSGEFCLEVTRQGSAVGVTETSLENSINVFPNPTEGVFGWNGLNVNVVEVYDNTGRLVLTQAQPNGSVDIQNLAEGMYTLMLHSEKGIYTSRVVKQ